MRACNLWEYLWMQEWLDTYTTEPERAERALKELEKAFNMAYMPVSYTHLTLPTILRV